MSPQQQLTPDDAEAPTALETAPDEPDALATPFPYGDAAPTDPIAAATPGTVACPRCDGETINGQGVLDCLECDWTGTR